MKTETVKLSQVKVNGANPRSIREAKLNLLVERLLVFPKMIKLRPVVVDDKMVALGGNMRVTAFNRIAKMSFDQVGQIIGRTKNYQRLSEPEKEALLTQWQDWLEAPTVEIVKASELSAAEKQEFIIADNASFGEWDYDKLANEWDNNDLASWGLDVWNPEPAIMPSAQPQTQYQQPSGSSADLQGYENEERPFDGSGLPAELQGQDITPDLLPKIEGTNETAMERIIIVYPKDRAGEVAMLVGLPNIYKVVYNINELIPGE